MLAVYHLAKGTAATADLAAQAPATHPPPPPPSLTERFGRAIYGQELFHGPRFQVVRDVEGVSSEGIIGTLTGTRERGCTSPGCSRTAGEAGNTSSTWPAGWA